MSLSKFIICLSVIAFMFTITGCSDYDSTESTGFGQLTLRGIFITDLKSPSGGTIEGARAKTPGDARVIMTYENGGYSHAWDSFDDFPQQDEYIVGSYNICMTAGSKLEEGFDSPYYKGNSNVVVRSNETVNVDVEIPLISSVVTVTYHEVSHKSIASVNALISSESGHYFHYPTGETRFLYVSPGDLRLYLDVTLNDGRNVRYLAARVAESKESTLYSFGISVSDDKGTPIVTTLFETETTEVEITDEFIAQKAPEVMTIGWSDSSTIRLPEGDTPDTEISALVKYTAQLDHLYLSLNSASLQEIGFPGQVDLMHLSDSESKLLSENGLTFEEGAGELKIDFTNMLSHLVYLTAENAISTFTVLAEDANGKVSEPVVLNVLTSPVEIEIVTVHKSIVGVNKGMIEILSTAPGFASHVEIEIEKEESKWDSAKLSDVTSVDGSKYLVTFPLPDGSGPVNVRVIYCDEVRANITIERVMPQFNIQVDPYANFCIVKIDPKDEAMLGIITDNVIIYANDVKGSVLTRYPDKGLLSIIGLTPSTNYKFRATMMANPTEDDFTSTVTVHTEGTPQLTNGDFEDRNDGVNYKDLPSGGRYSQTMVEIFNWQNHTSYAQLVPKGWANTNAKTFCRSSSNYNTWYMQPSVFTVEDVHSGDFAVALRSVAFDPDGELIPDYCQTGEPYLPYSLNVPKIAYRAAGKLFLGEYSFDAKTGKEAYKEGISWNSRPVSLNGFYKYQPSENNWNDRGLVTVEVIGEQGGKEVVIASARRILPLATGYTAFNLPLEYAYYGVKATRIKIMFASSDNIGTIAEETTSIITLADPRTSTSLGSQLWIDNVTLAY
ncbi:MAG: DUF4493 domain-containing protein [Muribaculum sp.]|nr:DUF4493 domain-containing protein [Muribaculum sp.]